MTADARRRGLDLWSSRSYSASPRISARMIGTSRAVPRRMLSTLAAPRGPRDGFARRPSGRRRRGHVSGLGRPVVPGVGALGEPAPEQRRLRSASRSARSAATRSVSWKTSRCAWLPPTSTMRASTGAMPRHRRRVLAPREGVEALEQRHHDLGQRRVAGLLRARAQALELELRVTASHLTRPGPCPRGGRGRAAAAGRASARGRAQVLPARGVRTAEEVEPPRQRHRVLEVGARR